jgi:hypothetical protein
MDFRIFFPARVALTVPGRLVGFESAAGRCDRTADFELGRRVALMTSDCVST